MALDTTTLKVTNNCGEVIWPALHTDGGVGPAVNGWEQRPGKTVAFNVSADWFGRFWGRTNCTFNADGTGPAVPGRMACLTGDCNGQLDCKVSGEAPHTLAEIMLRGGSGGSQTFYDISLVDGYNLPVGIVHIAGPATAHLAPSLSNPACIATAGHLSAPATSGTHYSNSTYPVPYEPDQTNATVARWCPWDLQAFPPYKPGEGIYPYPDDDIARPIFAPCLSACNVWGRPEDCCTGYYDTPERCPPRDFSYAVKAVCPDAYGYAYDDRTSTFVVPTGGAWEVVFCPAGRSTDILRTLGPELAAVGSANQGVDVSAGALARKVAAAQRSPLPEVYHSSQQAGQRSAAAGPAGPSCKKLLGLGLLVALGMGWF